MGFYKQGETSVKHDYMGLNLQILNVTVQNK